MRNNDVKTGNNGLIEPECCSGQACCFSEQVQCFCLHVQSGLLNSWFGFRVFIAIRRLVAGIQINQGRPGPLHGAILGTRCYPQCTPRALRVSVSVSTPIDSIPRAIWRGRGHLASSNRSTTVTHPRSFPCCRRCGRGVVLVPKQGTDIRDPESFKLSPRSGRIMLGK